MKLRSPCLRAWWLGALWAPWLGLVDPCPASAEAPASGSADTPAVEASSQSGTTSRSSPIEEIVVTSRKRPERLREVPISVTALGSERIERLSARRIQDISDTVPNLDYDRVVGFSNSGRSTIRGVGQVDPIGTLDPGVGLYVDGVFIARAQASLVSVDDVERVEVIRGPQGTIFGKSTIGGAVNVVTRKPRFEREASLTLGVGNFRRLTTRASLNIPWSEHNAAARISLATATRDGFEKERLGGTDPNDEKLLSVRAQTLFAPGDNLELRLSADLRRENQVLSIGKCAPQNAGGTPAFAQTLAAVGFPQACAGVASSRNPRRGESDVSFLRDELTTFGFSAQVSWEPFPGIQVRSISSVRSLDSQNFSDFDGTRIELIRPAVDVGGFDQTQMSQELQLSSSTLDGRLSYLAGIYAFREESSFRVIEGVLSRLEAEDIVAPFGGLSASETADRIRGAQLDTLNRVDNLTYAVFGQVSFDLTENLTLTAGLRSTRDRKRLLRRAVAVSDGIAPNRGRVAAGETVTFFERSKRFGRLTPSASIRYRFSDTLLGYVSYSTGFKSGGFDGRSFAAPDSDLSRVEFDSELLTTYEVGLKGSFFDQRSSFSAAMFYTIYEDIQLVTVGGTQDLNALQIEVLNAGEAVISGGELEWVLRPLPGLTFRSAIGVLHDRFKKFDDLRNPRAKDRSLQFASAYQTSTSIGYEFDWRDVGTVSTRIAWSTRSRQFQDAVNSDSLEAGLRGVLDARISLTLPEQQLEISLFGRNLLDREHLVGGVDFSDSFGHAQRFTGAPRIYGLELQKRF